MQKLRDISWLRLTAESAAIVVSILLAFAIDAWWDRYEEARREQIIIEALIRDFEDTAHRIERAIGTLEDFVTRCDKYTAAIDSGEVLPIGDLQDFAGAAFLGYTFRASLSAYDSSVATGAIDFLENSVLLQSLSDFRADYEAYLELESLGAEAFFVGPVWDIQRDLELTVKDLFWPVEQQEHPRLKEAEIRDSLSKPIVYAWVFKRRLLNQNMLDDLNAMKAATGQILTELESLK